MRLCKTACLDRCCFNTQPPEGGWFVAGEDALEGDDVSTHSRPKAAGSVSDSFIFLGPKFQHTAARRRLDKAGKEAERLAKFQHTAARRRLGPSEMGGLFI